MKSRVQTLRKSTKFQWYWPLFIEILVECIPNASLELHCYMRQLNNLNVNLFMCVEYISVLFAGLN